MLRMILVALLVAVVNSPAGADWLGFRGDGSAVSPDKNLPVAWSKDNLLWKVKLPGLGASSPVIVGSRVFLTCYSGYGG